MTETIRKVAKETLGVSSGKPKAYKESWWWNDEVHSKIKDKNKRFKEFMTCMEEEDRIQKRENYKEAKWAAKKAVAEAKRRAYEDFYQKLGTKEGEKHIYRLAKIKSRQQQDLETVKYIKAWYQFGFMPGRSTTEAIHFLRRLMEKYKERKKDLHMMFIDLEKAYDSIP